MDPEALAIARERLRPVESVHENQVQPEEHIYAEVHQEDPDAIEVASEESEVAQEATPDVVSQAGGRGGGSLGNRVAAAQASPPGLDQPRTKGFPAPHRSRRKHRTGLRTNGGLS